MSSLIEVPDQAGSAAECSFTLVSRITSHGKSVEQAQYITEHYVVTVMGGMTVVYARGLNGRFVVDRARNQLRPFDIATQGPRPEQIRSLLGELQIDEDDGPFVLDGFACRALRVTNRDARLVVSVETYCTIVDGIAETALDAERSFDAPHQPFSLPLRRNEVVVRSTTRALAADFEQYQTLQLTSIRPAVEQRSVLDEMLRYPVVEA